MKRRNVFLGLVVLAGCLFFLLSRLAAQTAVGTTSDSDSNLASAVQVTTDSGDVFNPRSQNGMFQRVGLKPGQFSNVLIQFPAAMAGQPISAAALDGGTVTLGNQGRIGDDGSISVGYRAANAVGQYRILIGQGDSIQTLQFWVRDLSNSQNNPPVCAAN